MKVLILGNYPPPHGGVPSHVRDLSDHLARAGIMTYVLSGGKGDEQNPKENLKIFKLNTIQKVKHFISSLFKGKCYGLGYKVAITAPKHFFRYLYNFSYTEQLFGNIKFDVVLCYNLVLFGPVARQLSDKNKVPYIISIFGEIYNPRHHGFILNDIYQDVISKASLVVSCSKHCANSVLKISGREVHSIQFGIDTTFFGPYKKQEICDLRAKHGIPSDVILIGYVGRFSDELGFSDFLTLADKLKHKVKGVHFLIAGNPDGNLSKARKFFQKNNTRAHLFVSPEYDDLAGIINMLDLSLVLSRGDRTCSSLAAMESLSCGVNVIAYSTGGIPEILDETPGASLVPEGDIKCLEDAVIAFISSFSKLKSVERQAISISARKFDKVNTNLRYMEIINSIHKCQNT
jgi:glycosyltransferase involved in cell wall biosynthesis